jgi:hypothetical protein
MLGATVGTMEAVAMDRKGVGWGEFLRVEILVDLMKPLARGRMLKLQGKMSWIAFQYECLPTFCFYYGVILHGRRTCPKKVNLHNQEDSTEFGLWLRAPSRPFRQERGLGRRGVNKSSSSQEKESYAEPPMSHAEGGGLNQGVGEGQAAGIPNPKQSKFQKGTSEDPRKNKGGKGSFLFKTQTDKVGFQGRKGSEREVYQDQRDGWNSKKDNQMKP